MKRERIDFFLGWDDQIAIHVRLENWAAYVRVRPQGWAQHPMWRQGKSGTRQWHSPEPKPAIDTLDGHVIEKAVSNLPEKNREAIRWFYVFPYINPSHMRKRLGVTDQGLADLARAGRAMLMNRSL